MKLIMENWRRWLGLKKEKGDFPADGTKPIDPSVYDIHAGGEETSIQDLNPSTKPVGAAIRNRPGISYEKSTSISDEEAREIVDFENPRDPIDDRSLNLPGQRVKFSKVRDFRDTVEDFAQEVTEYEKAKTLTPEAANSIKRRLMKWWDAAQYSPTIDIDLMRVKKEISQAKTNIESGRISHLSGWYDEIPDDEISETLGKKKW